MKLVHEASWMTYEEGGSIRIFEDETGLFHAQEGLSSVYSDDSYWQEPYVVSFAEVLELIDEWDEIEKRNEEYWENNG